MNWGLYMYYLCSNYLTTAPKHRPNLGKAQHHYWGGRHGPLCRPAGYGPVEPSHPLLGGPTFYWGGGRPPRPPSWLRPCIIWVCNLSITLSITDLLYTSTSTVWILLLANSRTGDLWLELYNFALKLSKCVYCIRLINYGVIIVVIVL